MPTKKKAKIQIKLPEIKPIPMRKIHQPTNILQELRKQQGIPIKSNTLEGRRNYMKIYMRRLRQQKRGK